MIDKTDKNIVYHLILRKPAQNRLAIHNTSVSSTIAFPGFSYKIFFIELITFLNPLHTNKTKLWSIKIPIDSKQFSSKHNKIKRIPIA